MSQSQQEIDSAPRKASQKVNWAELSDDDEPKGSPGAHREKEEHKKNETVKPPREREQVRDRDEYRKPHTPFHGYEKQKPEMLEKVKSLPEGPIFLRIFNASEETTEDDILNFYKDFKILNVYSIRGAPEFEVKCEDKASALGIIEKGPGFIKGARFFLKVSYRNEKGDWRSSFQKPHHDRDFKRDEYNRDRDRDYDKGGYNRDRERDQDRGYNKDREHDKPYNRDREQDKPYNRDRDHDKGGYNRDRDYERPHFNRDNDKPYNRDRDQERQYNRDRDQDRPYNKDRDYDRGYNREGDKGYHRDRDHDKGYYNRDRDEKPYNRDEKPYNRDYHKDSKTEITRDRQEKPFRDDRNYKDDKYYKDDRNYNKEERGYKDDRNYKDNRDYKDDRSYKDNRDFKDRDYKDREYNRDRDYKEHKEHRDYKDYNKDRDYQKQGFKNQNKDQFKTQSHKELYTSPVHHDFSNKADKRNKGRNTPGTGMAYKGKRTDSELEFPSPMERPVPQSAKLAAKDLKSPAVRRENQTPKVQAVEPKGHHIAEITEEERAKMGEIQYYGEVRKAEQFNRSPHAKQGFYAWQSKDEVKGGEEEKRSEKVINVKPTKSTKGQSVNIFKVLANGNEDEDEESK